MSQKPRIVALAGSTREASWNKKLIKIAAAAATSAGGEVTLIDLRDYPLPIFDEDLEAREGLPPAARKIKDVFLAHQGLLISSPEYNSSISAVLKNAIDWLSRRVPGEKPLACFDGKVAGLLSASPGQLGGLRGLVHLRAILGNIKVLVLPDQFSVSKAHEAFDESGALKDPKQREAVEAVARKLVEVLKKLGA
jgi:NAD(P)H-dependent FMN reductase